MEFFHCAESPKNNFKLSKKSGPMVLYGIVYHVKPKKHRAFFNHFSREFLPQNVVRLVSGLASLNRFFPCLERDEHRPSNFLRIGKQPTIWVIFWKVGSKCSKSSEVLPKSAERRGRKFH